MSDKLMTIIHENQEAIYAAGIEHVRQTWPHYAAAPDDALRRSWEAILEALADYWERGDEGKARTWAEMRAYLSANLGFPASEVLGGLDLLPGLIRPHLEANLTQPSELLGALDQLDTGVGFLRRHYLDAHFAIHEDRLARLHELTIAIGFERSLEQALERVAAAACELAGAGYTALAVYENGHLAQFIHVGLSDEKVQAIGDPPTGRGLLGALTEERRSIRLRDLTQHPRFSGFPPHHPEMHSFLGVPILVRDQVYGRLYLAEKEGANEFSEDDQRLIEMLAAHAATAIENARLHQETQERTRRTAALNEIARAISSSLEIGAIFPPITEAVQRLIRFDRASVALLDEGGETMTVFALRAEAAESELGRGVQVPTSSTIQAVVASRQGQLRPDLAESDDPVDQALVREGIRTALVAPLISRGEVIGTLNVGSRGSEPYTEEHLSLLQAVADQIASAVENARLYEEVRRASVSRYLVGQLLRDLQVVGGLSEGAMFRAGQELADRVGAETLDQFLDAFTGVAGLGTLTLVEADEVRQRWTFTGDGLVERQEESDRPTGNYTRGFLCGAVAQVLGGARVAGVEVTCQSMGDDLCRFVVQVVK